MKNLPKISNGVKKIFLILILIPFFISSVPIKAQGAGIVPCGGEGEPACQLCHIFVMFDSIIKFVLFKLVPPLAVFMIVIGGIMFIFAAGSPGTLEKAKKVLTATVIGLVIIFGAWIIINTFFMIIGVSDWTGLKEGWFQIPCPIQ